jgi:hypothetical protein
MAVLRDIKKRHGDLTCAEEATLGFFAIRHVEVVLVEKHQAVIGVKPGEEVVRIRGE